MIPKIIHYCWFGKKTLPQLAMKCIDSWKKYFPDYEIKEWNEDNFNLDIVPYTREAYEAKKYAFVSDYARFWVLYHYGGLYFDTDVEVIKPMDDIIARGAFMGCENEVQTSEVTALAVAPGLGLGCNPGLGLYKQILDFYSKLHFYKLGGLNTTTVVEYVTDILIGKGLKPINDIQQIDGVFIYPKEYFCPLDYETHDLKITPHTYTIHHYMASWQTPKMVLKKKIASFLGRKITASILSMRSSLFKAICFKK